PAAPLALRRRELLLALVLMAVDVLGELVEALVAVWVVVRVVGAVVLVVRDEVRFTLRRRHVRPAAGRRLAEALRGRARGTLAGRWGLASLRRHALLLAPRLFAGPLGPAVVASGPGRLLAPVRPRPVHATGW